MEPISNPSSGSPRKPRLWPYAMVFLLLALVWIVALELWLKPANLALPGAAVPRRLGYYLLPPVAVVVAIYLLRIGYVRFEFVRQEELANRAQQQVDTLRREEAVRQDAILVRKGFVLDVLAVGVAVEYLRDEQVWEELHGMEGKERVLSAHPNDYPSSMKDKERSQREREAMVLEQVLDWLSEAWPMPTFLAGPALGDSRMTALLEGNFEKALDHGAMQGRKLRIVEAIHDEVPDQLLSKAFDFLEQHPEVPVALLVAEDGAVLRHSLREEGAPELLHEGPRPKDARTECVAALLLGRKERIEPMRAFAQGGAAGAEALQPFWEKEQLARTAEAFSTSEWLPSAWPEPLLDAFAELPVLGRLHRPQVVSFSSKGEASRARVLKVAWQSSLECLDEGSQPERIIFDHGPVTQGRRLAPLSRALVELAPDFDVFDQGIDLHRRLGDTGAAAALLSTALGALSSCRERRVSASAFLRRENGASLVMISPPAECGGVPAEVEHDLAKA